MQFKMNEKEMKERKNGLRQAVKKNALIIAV